jgi:hypothetical protein
MEDLLNDMGVKSHKLPRTPSPHFTQPDHFVPQPYIPGSLRLINGRPPPPMPDLKFLDLTESRRRNGNSPPFFDNDPIPVASDSGAGAPPDQYLSDFTREDSMDWSPDPMTSKPKCEHRAFTENLPINNMDVFYGRVPAQQPTKLFGESPVTAEKGAFWFKVPPAPISEAHRLRNPPNKPTLRVVSKEQKENFFSNKKSSLFQPSSPKQQVEFQERRFFAPSNPRSEVPPEFLSSFGSWSLGDTPKVAKKSSWRFIWQGLTLVAAVVGGYQAWLIYGPGL